MKADDRRALRESIRVTRMATARDFLIGAISSLDEAELTLLQLGVLLLLDDGVPRTLKELAEVIGRSPSATSRLVDQLVRRKLLVREEDPEDRRARRVTRSPRAARLVAELLDRRTDAQISVMASLSDEERALVMRAFAILGEAAQRMTKKEVRR
ncbi:MarR family transcriptional regulator [Polyangium sp. y55x31]|uniref:MarR family winged helix-turn-helix transcriptional regulator n=1 Tax=Polyangium sp. y55x31 TaxID=3042688 RepID=UPI002482333E|nr:MarR family transcriptional regulator [Polyangium sp. y55x31]MDI1477500.1 MarR family transcriptional regulator [Polyangium sp. y55x31]